MEREPNVPVPTGTAAASCIGGSFGLGATGVMRL